MLFPNGNKYIGEWNNDLQHGNGLFINKAEGTKRQGEWKDGKRQTWTSQVFKTGSKK